MEFAHKKGERKYLYKLQFSLGIIFSVHEMGKRTLIDMF